MKIASILSFILAFTLSACLTDHTAQLLEGNWRVVSIQTTGVASMLMTGFSSNNPQADYILQFREDGNLNLRLDVNNCSGRFNTFNDSSLEIEPMGCTRVCCDTPFAEHLTGALSHMEHFAIQGKRLTLHGADGIIVARRD